ALALVPSGTSTFDEDLHYNDLGLPSSISYPWTTQDRQPTRSRLALNVAYDRGFVKTEGTTTPPQSLLSRVLYDASAAVSRYDFETPAPSMIYTSRTYDGRNRISRIKGPPGSFDTGSYGYDLSQNI